MLMSFDSGASICWKTYRRKKILLLKTVLPLISSGHCREDVWYQGTFFCCCVCMSKPFWNRIMAISKIITRKHVSVVERVARPLSHSEPPSSPLYRSGCFAVIQPKLVTQSDKIPQPPTPPLPSSWSACCMIMSFMTDFSRCPINSQPALVSRLFRNNVKWLSAYLPRCKLERLVTNANNCASALGKNLFSWTVSIAVSLIFNRHATRSLF